MKRFFYIVAVVLAMTWILTFFVFRSGHGSHVLFLMALVCWLHAIITIPQKKYTLGDINKEQA
jgi:hypothetical protein